MKKLEEVKQGNNMLPEMSQEFNVLLSKLMQAKQSIGTVKKDSTNPFHKSKYASLNAYIEASEQHLLDNGLILTTAGNGSFLEPLIVATLTHVESGQWMKSYLPILNPKNDSQGLGASVTYMRRYSIATLLGLVSEDDDGETADGRGKHDSNKKNKVPTETSKENESEFLDKYLNLFDKEEKPYALQYLKVVQKHFEWSIIQAVKELMKDTMKMFDSFNIWKQKIKKTEEK